MKTVYTYEILPEDNCMVVYRNPKDDAIIHMPTDDPKEVTDGWIKVGVWKKKRVIPEVPLNQTQQL